MGYCHNCGEAFRRQRRYVLPKTTVTTGVVATGATSQYDNWVNAHKPQPIHISQHPEQWMYLAQYGVQDNPNFYVTFRGHVAFLDTGRLIVSRQMHPKRYFLWKAKGHHPHFHRETTTQLVITEDIISAVRLANLGLNAMPLLGTHLTEDAKNDVLKYYDNFILHLDCDPAGFSAACELAKQLRGMGSVSNFPMSNPWKEEAKRLDDDQLRSIYGIK